MYGRAQNSSARAEERRQWPCQELQCIIVEDNNTAIALCNIQGVFFNWYPPKNLKYGKPRLGESSST